MDDPLAAVRQNDPVLNIKRYLLLDGATYRTGNAFAVVAMDGIVKELIRNFDLAGFEPKYAEMFVGPILFCRVRSSCIRQVHHPAAQMGDPLRRRKQRFVLTQLFFSSFT